MIKAAFFDIDGTFYSHKIHGVPESHLKVLEALKQNGIKTFLATGRHFEELKDLAMGQIAFDGYVMLTGQICTDEHKNVIFGNAIRKEDAEILFDAFEKKELPIMMVEKDVFYVNMQSDIVVNGQAAISSPVPALRNYEGAPIYQMVVYGGKALEEELRQKLPNCKIARWCPFGFDVISKTGGKVIGIQKMLEYYGIGQEEVIAFGDGENDMKMLQFAGIGVAMGNATDDVKKVDDYITSTNDKDGIAKVIEKFILN